MTAIVHYVLPGHELGRAESRVGERIGEFLERVGWARRVKIEGRWRWMFRLPTVCVVHGQYLLQRHWKRRRIKPGDCIAFVSRPLGDRDVRGKQIAGLVALIALSAFALWAGPALAGFLSLPAFAGNLFTAGMVIGGSLLINALVTPRAGGQAQQETVPQLYSLSAAGNMARPMETIPVSYGRLKKFCDYASAPWSELVGDDAYFHVLLCEGLGKYHHERIYLDDTVLWDAVTGFAAGFDAQVAFYDPGETVTLFPADVQTAAEVGSQQLPAGTPGGWVGPFAANGAGTAATQLACDFVLPAGCFVIDPENGNLLSRTIWVEGEARLIDDLGNPIGAWQTLFIQFRTFATRQPKRFSIKTAVLPGRYEARVRRVTAEPNENQGADRIVWGGLRAYLEGDNAFDNVSIVAIRIRANELTQGSARKFAVLSTRVLPIWDGSAWVEQATRNPFWAFADAATSTTYGARRPLSKLDLQAIIAQAVAAESRDDSFDYEFRSSVPAPEAFDTILKVARSRHRWAGDTLSVVRDELRPVPQCLLTDREIVRGTLALGFAFNAEDTADCVIVEYLDQDLWAPAEVQYPLNSGSFTAQSPATVRLDGIVKRAQASREAAFLWRQSQLRRITASLETEWDGRMLGFGSVIRVQSELPQTWGHAGVVIERSGLILTLNPAPNWEAATQHYIEIRTKRGKRFGPVKAARGGSDELALLDGDDLATVEAAQGMTLADALARVHDAEAAGFALGTAAHQARTCLVLSGRPQGDRVALSLVVDSDEVHDDDVEVPPALPAPPALRDQPAPQVIGLLAVFRQGVAEPILDATWFPAAGAFHYVAQVSYDDGESWAPLYEGAEPKFTAMVDYCALSVRVQAVGLRKGAWTQVAVAAPTIEVAPGAVSLRSFAEGVRNQVTHEFNRFNDRLTNLAQLIASTAGDQDAANWLDKKENRRLLSVARDALTASIEEVETVAVGTQTAFAAWQSTVSATYGNIGAFVSQTANAIAKVDGTTGALYTLSVNAGGKVSGFKLGNDGSTAVFEIEADVFRVGLTGVTGGSFVPAFQVSTVGGTPKLTLRGDMLADGTITAGKIAAGAINAVNIVASNVIVTGHLQAESATAVAYVSASDHSTPGPNNTTTHHTLATLAFNVAVGTLMIDGTAYFETSHAVQSGFLSCVLSILIDGVVVKTIPFVQELIQVAGDQQNFYALRRPIAIMHAASGVALGTRTVTLRASYTAPQNWTSVTITAKGPTLRAMESRR
jgi:hypothetical protein